jgi:ACR3 family arsenite transporter
VPGPFQAIGRMEVAQVNLPVGLLIWVMIIPMLMKVDFAALGEVRQHMRGIGVTLFVNWLVKPFSMALLGWLFIRQWFALCCPQTRSTATSPASSCWPRRPARPWCSCGAA